MLLERLVRSKSLCSRFVCVRGLRMHYRMGEPGQQAPSQAATPLPTVVLVHGQVVSSRYMEPLAEVLAERARVFVPDLPGFGLSAKPAVTLGMTSLAKYLAEWMGALSLPKAVVVGNSLGCQVAVELAVRHPERVSHLVLQGPTMDWRARAPAPQVARWLRAALHERPKLNLVMLMDLFSAGTRRAIGTFRMALDHEVERSLRAVEQPALVVRGSLDALVPERWAEDVACLLPNGHLAVIEGGTHAINYSAPRALARVITGFVEGRLA